MHFLGQSKFVHGNVRMDSIFVNKAGDWKYTTYTKKLCNDRLGGFELLSSTADSDTIDWMSSHHDKLSDIGRFLPPEVRGRFVKMYTISLSS